MNYSEIIQIAISEPLLNVSDEVIEQSLPKIESLKNIAKDYLSVKSIDCFIDYLKNRDVSVFKQVVVQNKNYLINEVVKLINNNDVFVDLGAFSGELPIDLYNLHIPFKKCYCFEISENNCAKLI